MEPNRLSICLIVFNEEDHIENCLSTFAPLADEFVIVRAIGNNEPDGTVDKAIELCREKGISIKTGEYRNEGYEGKSYPIINQREPRTWPHVDNFAAARQMAFDMATHSWCMWVDADDIFNDDEFSLKAMEVWKNHELDEFNALKCSYVLPEIKTTNIRERIMRRESGKWHLAIHECFLQNGEPKSTLASDIKIVHNPSEKKGSSPTRLHRNIRILKYVTKQPKKYPFGQAIYHFYLNRDLFECHEYEESYKYGQRALEFRELPETERYEILLNLASAAMEMNKEAGEQRKWALNALNVTPWRREALAMLATIDLMAERPKGAYGWSAMMRGLPMPKNTDSTFTRPWTQKDKCYGWFGAHLYHQSLRLCGKLAEAEAGETNVFEKEGRKISILHPTLGAPGHALQTYSTWGNGAFAMGAIQWLFGIHPKDTRSEQVLHGYRHYKLEGDSTSVWNALAEKASGHVLMAISDRWLPVNGWDKELWDLFKDSLDKPLVISFGDSMAFAMNRKAYEDLGTLLQPNVPSVEARAWTMAEAEKRGYLIQEPCSLFSIPRPEYRLPSPAMKHYPFIVTERPMYIICSKDGKPEHADFQSLDAHFELGWEGPMTHFRAKHLLRIGAVSHEDVIVTLPGREFLYQSLFNRVITWDEFKQIKSLDGNEIRPNVSGKDTLDLAAYFSRNTMRYPAHYYTGPGDTYAYAEDFPLINNFQREELFHVEQKYLCIALRVRPHMSKRNSDPSFARALLSRLRKETQLPIYLTGLDLPDFNIPGVTWCSLKKWITLATDPDRCPIVTGPLTGTVSLAAILAKPPTKIICFPHEACLSIDSNYATGISPCTNINKNERTMLPVGAIVADIIREIQNNL